MKTWKKVTTWIVSILALLALIVGGTVLYLIQKSKKEERLVNSAYKELIPDNIDSYPELKNYYLNLYRQGLIEKDLPISPDEDPTIPDKVTLIQGNCYSQFLDLNYDGLQIGLKNFDKEIDFEGYNLLGSVENYRELIKLAHN